jgi:hypothetical protein
MTGEVTSPALTARYYRRVTSGRWSMSMTDYAELADASRRLGDEHGRAGITPFGEPGHMHESAGSCGYTSYVCWDQARLIAFPLRPGRAAGGFVRVM